MHSTAPYEFFTTKDPGITASVQFDSDHGVIATLGFDLMLRDVTKFTQTLQAAASGKVFVTTPDGRLLELPALQRFERKGARLAALMKTPADIGEPLLLDAWSEPAEATGGDTYDLLATRRTGAGEAMIVNDGAERPVMLLADAVGHGIGPALAVTQVRAMLRMAVRTGAPLADVINHLNDQLCDDLTDGRFITMWLAELDAATHALSSFSAGQGPLLHYVAAEHRVHALNADMLPLGVLSGLDIELPAPIALARGDLFAVISDGVFDAMNPAGEMFGTGRVTELLLASRQEPPARILERLREAVAVFTAGAPADDDRTAIVLNRMSAGQ